MNTALARIFESPDLVGNVVKHMDIKTSTNLQASNKVINSWLKNNVLERANKEIYRHQMKQELLKRFDKHLVKRFDNLWRHKPSKTPFFNRTDVDYFRAIQCLQQGYDKPVITPEYIPKKYLSHNKKEVVYDRTVLNFNFNFPAHAHANSEDLVWEILYVKLRNGMMYSLIIGTHSLPFLMSPMPTYHLKLRDIPPQPESLYQAAEHFTFNSGSDENLHAIYILTNFLGDGVLHVTLIQETVSADFAIASAAMGNAIAVDIYRTNQTYTAAETKFKSCARAARSNPGAQRECMNTVGQAAGVFAWPEMQFRRASALLNIGNRYILRSLTQKVREGSVLGACITEKAIIRQ